MAITTQEARQVKQALKEEIARHTRLIEILEQNIVDHQDLPGYERSISAWRDDIVQSQKAVTAAAAALGMRPAEKSVEKRGPGRPPKSPSS